MGDSSFVCSHQHQVCVTSVGLACDGNQSSYERASTPEYSCQTSLYSRAFAEEQKYVVPPGASSIEVEMWGGDSPEGGHGGYMQVVLVLAAAKPGRPEWVAMRATLPAAAVEAFLG